MQVCYIVNPAAAGGDGELVAKQLEAMKDPRVQVFRSKTLEHAQIVARKLQKVGGEEVHTIITVGGDGLFHAVVNGIAPAFRVKIGMMPLGSGNDFARNFGYPDLRKSLFVGQYHAALMRCRVRWTDAIKIRYQGSMIHACNQFSLGFSGDVALEVSSQSKRSSAMYLKTAMAKAWDPDTFKVSGDMEGEIFDLYITNGRYLGGGIDISPNANLSDGKLETLVIPKGDRVLRYSTIGVAKLGLVRGFLGRLFGVTPDAFEEEITLNIQRPVAAQADGEPLLVPPGEIKLAVLGKALNVLSFK